MIPGNALEVFENNKALEIISVVSMRTMRVQVAGNPLSLLCSFISAQQGKMKDYPREWWGSRDCLRLTGTQMFWRNWAETVKGVIKAFTISSAV